MIGLGLGATVTPAMAAAFEALSRAETPRGTSALNAIQRIAAAIGTAAFAILLQHSITARQPGHPATAAAIGALSRQAGAQATSALAGAFGVTFWAAVVAHRCRRGARAAPAATSAPGARWHQQPGEHAKAP